MGYVNLILDLGQLIQQLDVSFNKFNLHVLNTCCNFESNNRTIYKAR